MTAPIGGDRKEIVLIGAGIMSATLGVFLKELEPALSITIFETLADCAEESSNAWNNAGTGHAANCELNYTPLTSSGDIDISKALEVNVEFDLSRQFWSYLVKTQAISNPRDFINACPHMSFVWGTEHAAFLRKRFEKMSQHHCYEGMNFSDSSLEISTWAPLIIEGRELTQPIAATRMLTGTDVDYGSLTHLLMTHLTQKLGAQVYYKHKVTGLKKDANNDWTITAKNTETNELSKFTANFVFIGAGGNAIELLQKSEIAEGKGYAGFPVSGIWLRSDLPELAERHHAKVYGLAPQGSPPMSVPHLDTRIISGKKSLLFGPYAGFSTKFLKHGSYTDLFNSLTSQNIRPLLSVARDDWQLSEYLISQVLQSSAHQFEMLQQFFPLAKKHDWREAVAGQRVQIIKPDSERGGVLEFGTELICSKDSSLVALLGASPGASTAAFIAQNVLKKAFAQYLTKDSWLPKLKQILPSYGVDLKTDRDACRSIRHETSSILQLSSTS
ncbi:MAG: malate dehydrogenase (quinone) [Alphaproteobacteria bacterium]|nr:malate dehydrogenase (quinone) [Alphaproteobacteria bacterium]